MRTLQALYARYRHPTGTFASDRPAIVSAVARRAVREALAGLETALTAPDASGPNPLLTQDGVNAYALALMRLRECAGAAGCRRLSAACDALSVTVSRLIENRANVRRDQYEALARFAAHAREMIELEAAEATPSVCEVADFRTFGRSATLQ